jgi:alpha-1,6-mannosyltransferase
MKSQFSAAFTQIGGISFFAGIIILASFLAMPGLPNLRGANVTYFLGYFSLAALAYTLAVVYLPKNRIPLKLIWGLAILFRMGLLFTEPSLSDDVYRYAWDGHLLNQGVNPYAYAVEAPQLDAYDIPLRASVNHAWMASPYLPTSQIVFGLVTFVAPQSTKAFQVVAVLLDLLTGWLVFDLLRLLRKPVHNVLIYLWNPLVVIEFAHGAHIDALMIYLMVLTIWLLTKSRAGQRNQFLMASVFSLALATLTKLLPILLAPLLLRRWGWKRLILFIGLILLGLSLFLPGAGWVLFGPLDGTGLFGAFRIYSQYWNFNSGIYHWLEVLISGYPTPGAVPVEIVGERPAQVAKLISMGIFSLSMLYAFVRAQKHTNSIQGLLQLALIPLGAYLLLTPTLHPWYLVLIIPLLPFATRRHQWPWLYLSLAVVLSYLTYLNPADLREHAWVRWVEYLPMYILLAWGLIAEFMRKKIE